MAVPLLGLSLHLASCSLGSPLQVIPVDSGEVSKGHVIVLIMLGSQKQGESYPRGHTFDQWVIEAVK